MNRQDAVNAAANLSDTVAAGDVLMCAAIQLSANRLRALDLSTYTLKDLKRELKDLDGRTGLWRTK